MVPLLASKRLDWILVIRLKTVLMFANLLMCLLKPDLPHLRNRTWFVASKECYGLKAMAKYDRQCHHVNTAKPKSKLFLRTRLAWNVESKC